MTRALRLLPCVTLLCSLLLAGTASAATQVLVIAGLGGEAQFDARFTKWSEQVAKASATATGDVARVQRLAGESARREDIQAALRAVAERLREGDQFVLVLLGHGSFDGSEYRFNVAGPDITGSEMLALLDRIPAGVLQLVVNATSTSGAIADRWVKPNRVVITATRTGGERNAPRFGAFWAEALSSEEADRDKDGAVTALEAFDYATRKVNDAYKSDAAVVTEHAKVTGNEPTRFVVARLGAAAMFANDAQLIAMRTEQAGIERRLAQLQLQRKELQQDEYFNRIEPVLVELAKLGARVDARLTTLGARAGDSFNAKP